MSKLLNESTNENIYSIADVMDMLDSLLRDSGSWWDKFYSDREKPVPFFKGVPDENLVEYFERKLLLPARVLEIGCGPGRNALYFAQQGCQVDGIDISEEAINWAIERMNERGLKVNFTCSSIFDFEIEANAYDIVYDSGCLHHVPPHRRMDYISLVKKSLKPGGFFGLTCFASGCQDKDGGSEISDWEVYREKSLKGGLAFSEEKLKRLFCNDFKVIEIRKMKELGENEKAFGKPFLWAVLFEKIN